MQAARGACIASVVAAAAAVIAPSFVVGACPLPPSCVPLFNQGFPAPPHDPSAASASVDALAMPGAPSPAPLCLAATWKDL